MTHLPMTEALAFAALEDMTELIFVCGYMDEYVQKLIGKIKDSKAYNKEIRWL